MQWVLATTPSWVQRLYNGERHQYTENFKFGGPHRLTVEGDIDPVGQHNTERNERTFNHDESPAMLGGGTLGMIRWYRRSIQTLYRVNAQSADRPKRSIEAQKHGSI